MRRYRQEIAEKEALAARLKNEVVLRNRELKEVEKAIQVIIAPANEKSEMKVKSQEVSHLFELLREIEKKDQEKSNSLKKQYAIVKRMEK